MSSAFVTENTRINSEMEINIVFVKSISLVRHFVSFGRIIVKLIIIMTQNVWAFIICQIFQTNKNFVISIATEISVG